MVEPSVYLNMAQVDGDTPITLILRWTQPMGLSPDLQKADRTIRAAAAKLWYAAVKHDVLAYVSTLPDIRVQDMPGTGMALLTATRLSWDPLLEVLDARPEVDVCSNEAVTYAI